MQLTLEIPEELADSLTSDGLDPDRTALEAIGLEAIGLEAYRQRRITGYQLRTLLGLASRYELEGFLKEHQVYDYSAEDFEKDLAGICDLRGKQPAGSVE